MTQKPQAKFFCLTPKKSDESEKESEEREPGQTRHTPARATRLQTSCVEKRKKSINTEERKKSINTEERKS